MKRHVFIILILSIFTLHLEGKKLEGIIINNHDTINVTFKVPINSTIPEPKYTKIQYRIKYIDTNGKKNYLFPYMADEIQFNFKGEKIRFLVKNDSSIVDPVISEGVDIFLKLEVEGELNLYYYFYKAPLLFYVEDCILEKKGTPLRRVNMWTFRNDIEGYFDDCTDIFTKIENDEYGYTDIRQMVALFNLNCK